MLTTGVVMGKMVIKDYVSYPVDPRWIWVCVHFSLGFLGEVEALEGEVWG
jgi:hypothetical protein